MAGDQAENGRRHLRGAGLPVTEEPWAGSRRWLDSLIATASEQGLEITGVRVEPYRPGLEVIVGGVVDPDFGPQVSVWDGSSGVAVDWPVSAPGLAR